VTWFVLFDVLGAQYPVSYWENLRRTLDGILEGDAERVMVEAITRIRRGRGRVNALRAIEETAKEPEISDEAVEEMGRAVDSMRAAALTQEDGDLGPIKARYRDFTSQQSTGIITGFPTIDRRLDCLFFGELVVIMGRTFTGKTFVALNLLDVIAGGTTHNIGFFSLEMPAHLVYERIAQIHFSRSRHDIKTGFEYFVFDDFDRHYRNVRIFERIYSVAEIKAQAIRYGLKVVFVDFLGLVKPSVQGSPYEKTTATIRDLKQMAKELGVCVIVLNQLSRAGGHGEIPVTLDMARESGAIEELGDIIIGIWRPEQGGKSDDPVCQGDTLMVTLLKNKRGIGARVACHADQTTGKIREIEIERRET
jgi:replicative DNA helicase